jgi:hypothetical protein
MASIQMKDEFGNLTTGIKHNVPGCGKYHPVPVPWEECQCGYLPHEDRDMCSKHGDGRAIGPPKTPQSQPRRLSVGRTRPLYDLTAGSSALDKIEDIVNRAMMDGEFTVRQRGIMRWALGKCRSIMTELREDFESL